MRLVNDIYVKMTASENIFSAWDAFKRGKSNKADVLAFERNLEDNIFALRSELKSKTYCHGPYSAFHIFDPKHRLISKAEVRDRLVHYLVFKELYQIFNPMFYYHSYSSRIGKGTHLAINNLAKYARKESRNHTRQIFALKCDIKQFFHSVNHQKLLALIKRKIKDNQFLWLIEKIINSFNPSVDKIPERERES